MAKPNYNFAKRQRELAKKAKKEEKLLRKAGDPAAPSDPADDTEPADGGETVVDAETPRQP